MQWYKKIPYLIIFLTLLGCSTMKIDDFANTEPEFNLMQFFEGNVEAWGIVEDRFGNLKRQFKVDMNGTIKDGVLTLEEDFIYADGEKDKRIWQFSKLDESSYKGLANDIIGEAIAKEKGNAFNMKYKMDLDLGFLSKKQCDSCYIKSKFTYRSFINNSLFVNSIHPVIKTNS